MLYRFSTHAQSEQKLQAGFHGRVSINQLCDMLDDKFGHLKFPRQGSGGAQRGAGGCWFSRSSRG